MSLRALDGSITPLALNSGTPAPPDAGYFQIVDVNVSSSPAIYTMYARAPATLTDPANYDVLVVNRSLRADRTDSAPMTLALRARKIFTVSVMVNGSGHVTSNPGGIQCGTSFSGAALSPCTFTFGAGTVSLLPNANDTSTTRFLGWSGNCAPGVQVCTLTLDGSGPLVAVATFVARTSTDVLPATCQAAPPIAGFQWIGRPDCATGLIDEHPGIALQCDDVGFYCCEPGPANSNAPRCGGIGKVESPPDCRRFAPRGVLRQPGGCYEFSQ
ncbi:MAG: hypothetical protein HOP14_02915 [Acidobacteria bacterium]|nr:hypothetical protein [Acidobacteriota bacterium]